MKTQRFGIEIETIQITRCKAAKAIQKVVGGTVAHTGRPTCYDPWEVTDGQGRKWKVVADASLNSVRKNYRAEVVSPILTWEDIPILQEVVRALRRAGAKVNYQCGIHIHIDAAPFDGTKLANLTKIIYKQENLILKALKISDTRLRSWTKRIGPQLIREIESQRPRTLDDFNRIWYGYGYVNSSPGHYHFSRYHGVNLHNVWYRGTIEFRWFEGTLHAGKIKTYIQLCMALTAKALKARASSSRQREFSSQSAKYDLRVFLLSLGMIGKEFKTARFHLLKDMPGSAAWKNGSQRAA